MTLDFFLTIESVKARICFDIKLCSLKSVADPATASPRDFFPVFSRLKRKKKSFTAKNTHWEWFFDHVRSLQ